MSHVEVLTVIHLWRNLCRKRFRKQLYYWIKKKKLWGFKNGQLLQKRGAWTEIICVFALNLKVKGNQNEKIYHQHLSNHRVFPVAYMLFATLFTIIFLAVVCLLDVRFNGNATNGIYARTHHTHRIPQLGLGFILSTSMKQKHKKLYYLEFFYWKNII